MNNNNTIQNKAIDTLRSRGKYFNVTYETIPNENGFTQQTPVVQIKRTPLIILLSSLALLFASIFLFKTTDMTYGLAALFAGLAGLAFCIFVKWGGWIRVFPNKVEVRYGIKSGKYKPYPRYHSSTNLVYSHTESRNNHRDTTVFYKVVISSTTQMGTTLAYRVTEDDGGELTRLLNLIFKPSDDTPSDQLQDPMNAQADAWSSF